MGSHGDSVLESGLATAVQPSGAAALLFKSAGGARDSAAQVRSHKGALRISWPKSTVARRADIQAEDRQVRVGSNSEILAESRCFPLDCCRVEAAVHSKLCGSPASSSTPFGKPIRYWWGNDGKRVRAGVG
jgi:hypothetical protein